MTGLFFTPFGGSFTPVVACSTLRCAVAHAAFFIAFIGILRGVGCWTNHDDDIHDDYRHDQLKIQYAVGMIDFEIQEAIREWIPRCGKGRRVSGIGCLSFIPAAAS